MCLYTEVPGCLIDNNMYNRTILLPIIRVNITKCSDLLTCQFHKRIVHGLGFILPFGPVLVRNQVTKGLGNGCLRKQVYCKVIPTSLFVLPIFDKNVFVPAILVSEGEDPV